MKKINKQTKQNNGRKIQLLLNKQKHENEMNLINQQKKNHYPLVKI